MEHLIRVCRASWQASAQEGKPLCDDDQLEFIIAVSHDAAQAGMLDASLLYLDGEPISFHWGMAHHPLTTIAAVGFDPAYRDEAPGVVHKVHLLQDSIARGFRRIEDTREQSEYKRQWSNLGFDLHDFVYYPHRRTGRLRTLVQRRWDSSVVYRMEQWRQRRQRR